MIPLCQPLQLSPVGSVISNKQGGVICKFYYGITGMDCSTVVCVCGTKKRAQDPTLLRASAECQGGWSERKFSMHGQVSGGKCWATSLLTRMSGTGIMVADLKLPLSILQGTLSWPAAFLWFTDLNTLKTCGGGWICAVCAQRRK